MPSKTPSVAVTNLKAQLHTNIVEFIYLQNFVFLNT
jgi:hypothetical protein